jgi:hypothetical protein
VGIGSLLLEKKPTILACGQRKMKEETRGRHHGVLVE